MRLSYAWLSNSGSADGSLLCRPADPSDPGLGLGVFVQVFSARAAHAHLEPLGRCFGIQAGSAPPAIVCSTFTDLCYHLLLKSLVFADPLTKGFCVHFDSPSIQNALH